MARTKRPARKAAAKPAVEEAVVEVPAEEAEASVEPNGNPVNDRPNEADLMSIEPRDDSPAPKRFQDIPSSKDDDRMTASEQAKYKTKSLTMRRVLAAQEQVRVRVAKVHGPQTVIINGVRFNIPTNVYVSVPLQVAKMLEDAEVI